MPKVKPSQSYKKKYSEKDINLTLAALCKGMSKRRASLIYGIPRQTLQFRLSDKFRKPFAQGRRIVEIVDNLQPEKRISMQEVGCTNISKKLFDIDNRPNPFKDNVPGYWRYKKFLVLHPDLVNRIPESVSD